jgi:hypothetical protein
MLCESQPPVSCAGAKAHSLSARALLLDALGTVARYATAPITSSLISRTGYSRLLNNRTHRLGSHLSRTGHSCMLNNRTHRLI